MTTKMTIKVYVKSKGTMEVRIEEGRIEKVIFCSHTGGLGSYNREKKEDINICLRMILDEDIEAFKNILRNIEEDAEFFSYNKSLLDAKRESKEQKLLDSIKGFTTMLAKMQAEIDKYML